MTRFRSFAAELLRISFPVVILAVAVAGFFAIGEAEDPARQPEATSDVPVVETVRVEPYDAGFNIEVDGLVVPYRTIQVAAEVAGRIVHKSLQFDAGRFVSKGTLLIEIDSSDYALEVERLTKELDRAQIALEELDVETANNEILIRLAEEDVNLRKREVERLSRLPKGIATNTEIDQARSQVLAARNALQTLQKQQQILSPRRVGLELASELTETLLRKARLDLQRTKVFAPVDGVVVSESVEQESFVQRGTLLGEIEDVSQIEVKCSLKVDDLYWLWQSIGAGTDSIDGAKAAQSYQVPKAPVSVVYEVAGQEYRWQGTLDRYDGIGLDERTRTVPCRVAVPNPREVETDSRADSQSSIGPPALVRGMFVEVRINAQPRTSLVSIPDIAVRPGNRVWKISNGKLAVQPIKVARSVNDRLLVHAAPSNLAAGDKVIVTPVAAAFDGMSVREREVQ